MLVDNKYGFGDIVYLKIDKEQLPRMVTRMSLKPTEIQYCLSQGTIETWHMDFELSKEKDIVLKTT